MAVRRLTRVQEKGQVTLPSDVRKRLGLKKGDLVAFVDTDEGVLITRQEVLAAQVFDKLGALLKEQGVTLDDLIESGRDVREELFREKYGQPRKNNTA